MTTPATRPAARYGDRPHGRRRLWFLVVAGVLLAAGVGWFLLRAADEQVRSSLVAWEDPAGGVLAATIEVVRRPGVAVTCDLVAVDLRRVVVGQTNVEIAAGEDRRIQVRAEIPLEGDAVAPELRGCEPVEG
ncbi:MAG: DUF4307 domain-containing protein [Jiangellaceae bacterium]